MDAAEILRMVDSISRDKTIDKTVIIEGIEEALQAAARKKYDLDDIPPIKIDRESGEVIVLSDEIQIDVQELGRIAAQSAKQIIIQRIREAERDKLYEEFEHRVGDIINGTVMRFEGPHIIVNLGRVEAILSRGEQVPGESFRPGERIRAYVKDVEKKGQKVKVFASRKSIDFVRRLFELEVPEILDGTVEIMSIAREPGYRTKVAVESSNEKVDALGACVGVRGSRIKNVVDELNGEKVDIIRWSDDLETLIKNALKPADIYGIGLFEDEEEGNRAEVYVMKDQLSLAIGKGGQNVRLASKMCGWEIDILEVVEESDLTEEEQAALEASEDGADIVLDAPAEDAATEETTPEAPAEEAPVDETPAEEAPAENAAVEEAPAGDAPVEEAATEVPEEVTVEKEEA
jgi:N utilization substance protein A